MAMATRPAWVAADSSVAFSPAFAAHLKAPAAIAPESASGIAEAKSIRTIRPK